MQDACALKMLCKAKIVHNNYELNQEIFCTFYSVEWDVYEVVNIFWIWFHIMRHYVEINADL